MKLKFTLTLLLFSFLTAFSQNEKSYTISVEKNASLNKDGYDMTQHNRPKYISSPFTEESPVTASRSQNNTTSNLSTNPDIEAFAQLTLNRWGVLTDMDTNGELFYNAERIGNTFTVKTYDNDLEVVENFSIDVHDNQLGFLMGEGGNATNIGFFNIESWSFQTIFDAVTQNDQLSNKFNRVATSNGYKYLIGVGQPDEENGNLYGVIDEFDEDGTLLNRQRFLLPNDAILFDPILTRYALMPNLFSQRDDALHYMYLYKQQSQDNSIFNNVLIAKDSTDVVVEFRGDTPNGNITGSTFLRDGNGNYDKMTIQYEPSASGMLVDFYRLPFDDNLGIDNQTETKFFYTQILLKIC